MAVGGIIAPGWKPAKPKPNIYETSIKQQAGDYDTIMGGYRNILNRPTDPRIDKLIQQYQGNLNQPGYTPGQLSYQRGPEMTGAFNNLSDLATTGGLSEGAQADLRARGISPIRSVYANAQRNIDRQKSLQGGYSPNYTAATAKMSRDLSEQIASQTQNVNAQIAEMVQRGRLSAAPVYAEAAQRETGMMGDIDKYNLDEKFRAAQLNQSQRGDSLAALERLYGMQSNRDLEALRGMTGLYGTTPALPEIYGRHGFQREQLGLQKKAQDDNRSNSLIDAYQRSRMLPQLRRA